MRTVKARAIAVVGAGAVLPDAPDVATFWANCKQGRYSISEVPSDRWDPEFYWDPDPKAPDKTYSKIGGWVQDWEWEPLKWRLPLPPKVDAAMDRTQKLALAAARQALLDYGHPDRPLDSQRTAVILGNAMAGELHYRTVLRISFPEIANELAEAPSFAALPAEVRAVVLEEMKAGFGRKLPEITEDTMPGELANIIAGRIANLFDFNGPNFVCDAACASAMAAIDAAIEGLEGDDFDTVVTGGVDANMSASTYAKFCKIGALSATGTRPYAAGADGFVMGEGAAVFVLKRLADAERDGDRIYAVIRGIAGSSDGRGKGITAPNPVGQRLAVERAWRNAGITPNQATLIEGHGTSTRVGDVVEVESLSEVFRHYGFDSASLPLGSVKSNIGHLKGAAGAAGMLKAVLALDEKQLPPSLGFERPNPNIDFARSPFYVNRELQPWQARGDDLRRAGISAFGFGGTNFHLVLEEYVPGRSPSMTAEQVAVDGSTPRGAGSAIVVRPPLRGALLVGADSEAQLRARLEKIGSSAEAGTAPPPAPPRAADLAAAERIAIDYGDAGELATKAKRALKALGSGKPKTWSVLAAQGIYRGGGTPGKVAFLYTGQGSQYVNMMRGLRQREPIVARTFAEADAVMEPLLGRPLSELIFVDDSDKEKVAEANALLRQTAITQPAVLAVDVAMTRLLAAYGIEPDMVMGHSLGEYGALVAAGALDFREALAAVSARGNEMTKVSVDDYGEMAAVFAPIEEIERVIESIDGYVVVANINSTRQAVIGGASEAMEKAMEAMRRAEIDVRPLPVSHAFHTAIVAPAAVPLRRMLQRLDLRPPRVPTVANVTGGFYPSSTEAMPEIIDLLAEQIASPVQFVKGLETLYEAGARVFVEVGPKRALHGFVLDVLGDRSDVMSLFTNHPRLGDEKSFNSALCGLWASGHGAAMEPPAPPVQVSAAQSPVATAPAPTSSTPAAATTPAVTPIADDPRFRQVGELVAQALAKGFELYSGGGSGGGAAAAEQPVVVTGAALGLPGGERVFDDTNVGRILAGEQFISPIPQKLRQGMVDRNITRLVKNEHGEGHFETIGDASEVIKLAARRQQLDLAEEFGYPKDRLAALDITSQLAIGAGLDALRDAGLPLAMQYRTTTTGTLLPERWLLPEALRDETGVIFASAFPGVDSFAHENQRYYRDLARRERLAELEELRAKVPADESADESDLADDLDRRLAAVRAELEQDAYTFDRRFLLRLLSMGHSQFAELIGARGPNTQINSACASTTMAVGLAEDWIRQGRCRRVVIISADDVTSDNLLEWLGAGFLASGAAATDERIEDAAIPFDRRRHGMLIGMGAAGIVVESAEAAGERGIRPITEVLGTVTANSAFHGTRLDVEHICGVMESLVAAAERKWGIDRRQIAGETVFVSHETYTPARGGSAQAEVDALRQVFGDDADRIVVANTKGFTGHPMAVGIEDIVAIKTLETGLVPPVANFRDVDPDLGRLNLSRGGSYPVRYALRLGAGFGSQIAMSLMRWVPTPDGARTAADALGYTSRIADPSAWQSWLRRAGDGAGLEVVQRTLRLKDSKMMARRPATAPTPAPAMSPTGAPTTQPPPPTPTSAPVAADPVRDKVLEIVAEKTGYPPEMLDLDLDLEADLGVDTVKQAETFAAIRAAWEIPRDDDLALRDYPTLAHTIQFVYDKRPDLERPVAATPQPSVTLQPAAEAPPAIPVAPAVADPVREKVLEIVAEKTGYPPEMLDLDLDLEADLGVDTVKQAETFAAIRAAWEIPRDDQLALRDYPTLAHTIQFVYDKRPDLTPPSTDTTQPTPTTTPTTPVAPQVADDPVRRKVLEIVADKTGYPSEMLDLDLDLEADLGVDTVKQAETFAAIREAWEIPRDDNLALRDYPTLAHTIQFVYDNRPDLRPETDAPAKTADPTADPTGEPQPDASGTSPTPTADAAEAEETGTYRRVPVPLLRPPLELCVNTEVTLGAGTRVVLRPDQGGVAAALAARLEKLGVEVLVLGGDDQEAVTGQLAEWLAAGPIHGVYWLPALDRAAELTEMTAADWGAAIDARLRLLYTTMRALYDAIGEPGTFLISATRLGGLHGYDEEGAWAPLGGAVTGFTKTFKRERPDALVKAVDFGPSRKSAALADRLIDETQSDPGVVEVGYQHDRRWTIGLEERQIDDSAEGMRLDGDSVFLVTGAAGSIVSAIVADLAAASGGTFHLLDIAPKPNPDDPDLQKFSADRDSLKPELFERIKASGERPTPAKVERLLAGLEREQAALAAIQAVERAGGRALYQSVNLLDGQAVEEAVEQIRQRHDRIDVVVHAAGLEISHMLPDKEPAEFDRVFDVKAEGYFHLLRALAEMPLGAVVAFSSIAGRFGNAGQTDYASANDLLCKLCSSLRGRRPGTRGIAIDWTAWGEIGMATRGSIPKMMEAAGIDMLPPTIGIPVVRQELTAGDAGEVVIGRRLGGLLAEWHDTGGLDLAAVTALEGGSPSEPPGGLMSTSVRGMGLHTGLTVETELVPAEQPFLQDHQIDGTPVLPGVMGVEAFAETARLLFPDWHVAAIEKIRFQAPFKFYRHEPRTVTVQARFHLEGEEVVAVCRLLGSRQLPKQTEPVVTEHFAARVRLSREAPAPAQLPWPGPTDGATVSDEEIYRIYFHGPAYQVVERAWAVDGSAVGLLPANLPPNHTPTELPLVTSPRLVELCFQTAGLWELGRSGRYGLPAAIDRLSWLGSASQSDRRLCAVVRPGSDGSFDARVVDESGAVLVILDGYRTIELPVALTEETLEPLRAAMK